MIFTIEEIGEPDNGLHNYGVFIDRDGCVAILGTVEKCKKWIEKADFLNEDEEVTIEVIE